MEQSQVQVITSREKFAERNRVERPAAAAVWEAHGDAVDEVLGAILPLMLSLSEPCYLKTAFDVSQDQLGPGEWISVHNGQWCIPRDLAAADFLGSTLHDEGNYFIYRRSEPLDQLLELPWWGPPATRRQRRNYSARALVEGLRAARVQAAIAVHPDALDLVVVVP